MQKALTKEENFELYAMYQNENDPVIKKELKDQIFEGNMPFVYSIVNRICNDEVYARKLKCLSLTRDDVAQIVLTRFYEKIDNYNPEKGTLANYLATVCLHHCFFIVKDVDLKTDDVCVSYDAPVTTHRIDSDEDSDLLGFLESPTYTSQDDLINQTELSRLLTNYHLLSTKEKFILMQNAKFKTFTDTAKAFGVTREMGRKLFNKAAAKLKKYSKELPDFVKSLNGTHLIDHNYTTLAIVEKFKKEYDDNFLREIMPLLSPINQIILNYTILNYTGTPVAELQDLLGITHATYSRRASLIRSQIPNLHQSSKRVPLSEKAKERIDSLNKFFERYGGKIAISNYLPTRNKNEKKALFALIGYNGENLSQMATFWKMTPSDMRQNLESVVSEIKQLTPEKLVRLQLKKDVFVRDDLSTEDIDISILQSSITPDYQQI